MKPVHKNAAACAFAGGFTVMLQDKPIMTPAKAPLVLRSGAIASASAPLRRTSGALAGVMIGLSWSITVKPPANAQAAAFLWTGFIARRAPFQAPDRRTRRAPGLPRSRRNPMSPSYAAAAAP